MPLRLVSLVSDRVVSMVWQRSARGTFTTYQEIMSSRDHWHVLREGRSCK